MSTGSGKNAAQTHGGAVPGGGFTETGPGALEIQREVAALAAEHGMALCGPNCMGVISPVLRSAMYIGTIPASLLPGRVAMVSQSGSVVEAAVNMGPRIGFSALVSCGNEAVTTVGQYFTETIGNTTLQFGDGGATSNSDWHVIGFAGECGEPGSTAVSPSGPRP